jgi:hypothetical protein
MTTIRTAGNKVQRFAWAAGKPVAESDDAQLPQDGVFSESPIASALERPLWRAEGDRFVFYDLYAGETIEVAFDGGVLKSGTSTASRFRAP